MVASGCVSRRAPAQQRCTHAVAQLLWRLGWRRRGFLNFLRCGDYLQAGPAPLNVAPLYASATKKIGSLFSWGLGSGIAEFTIRTTGTLHLKMPM
jgi:hypothetical protein